MKLFFLVFVFCASRHTRHKDLESLELDNLDDSALGRRVWKALRKLEERLGDVPAKITSYSPNISANRYDRVLLSCDADGIPSPTISWTKDGHPFATTWAKQIVIQSAQFSDDGEYRCKATNSGGSSESPPIRLSVKCWAYCTEGYEKYDCLKDKLWLPHYWKSACCINDGKKYPGCAIDCDAHNCNTHNLPTYWKSRCCIDSGGRPRAHELLD